jgi:hypothetical protein
MVQNCDLSDSFNKVQKSIHDSVRPVNYQGVIMNQFVAKLKFTQQQNLPWQI